MLPFPEKTMPSARGGQIRQVLGSAVVNCLVDEAEK
jgi:hypothetical protein